TTIRGELLTLKTETQNAIHVLKTSSDQHGASIVELQRAASQSADEVTALQSEIKRLRTEMNQLTEKHMDLEGRSRRQNIATDCNVKRRGRKGAELNGFVSQLLKEVLTLDDLPLVDPAHGALRRRPDDTGPPRVVRPHYYRDVTTILRKAMTQRDLAYQGQKIRIFPDFTAEIAKRRAAFNGVRALLRDKPGVRYGLLYPAKLRVTFRGAETMFTNAKEAQRFVELHFGAGGD
uniref:L1 transposable element RRM domain-containing protein n=1 Tax=Poecilia formosa TaxID=48698 RepID=A0A087YRW3_POEFO